MVLRYAHLAPDHLSHAAACIERNLAIVESNSTLVGRPVARDPGEIAPPYTTAQDSVRQKSGRDNLLDEDQAI